MAQSVSQPPPAILFTAFEPSGDAHAAPVIRELRRVAPKLQIYAWGGPLMQQAGAELVQETVEAGAMGISGLKRASEIRRERKRIKEWASHHRVLAHVPVDSPAANFPIVKVMRRTGAKIIHLVAPQLWAWGSWRKGKLRRNTDLVLCLLPFEEQWFNDRNIPAKFIGHPSISDEIDSAALRKQTHGLPQGAPRVAIFPGSRVHEVRANIKLLISVFTELQGRNSGMGGVIVAANPKLARLLRKKINIFPNGLHMITGEAKSVIAWCDIALAVSGTITLDLTAQRKPMIGIYKTGLISWLCAKVLLRTRYRLLPNIIADREIVPEFVPYIGGPFPIVKHAARYMHDSKHGAIQSEELHRVCLRFANHRPAQEAAKHILDVIKSGVIAQPSGG
ncbi:MAG: hypothetical protein IH984_08110 [Planctomycetes bacterium]|nr:hypothetical protein [Planctomycetota bacterium]